MLCVHTSYFILPDPILKFGPEAKKHFRPTSKYFFNKLLKCMKVSSNS